MSIRKDRRQGDALRAIAMLLSACPIAMPAGAQTAPTLRDTNLVLSRTQAGYDAEGIPIAGFRAYPSVVVSAVYDDNIYAVDTNKIGSAIGLIEPALRVDSQWSRHFLSMEASGTFERYASRKSENNDRYRIAASGRADLRDFATLNLQGQYLRSIEARGTAGDILTAIEPIRYTSAGASGGPTLSIGNLNASVVGEFDRIHYTSARVGGGRVSQRYRNRRYYSGDFQLAYALSPAVQPFVEYRREQERYDQNDRATSLSSTGTVLLGGVKVALTQLLTGRAAAGYRWRNYRSPANATARGLSYDLDLVWNPRTLVSVTLGASKSIEESPDTRASGIIDNKFSVGIDYEFYRNVLLGLSVVHSDERYRGMDRTDRRVAATGSVRFLVNRLIQLEARYSRTVQNGSGQLGRDYRDNVVVIALTLHR